MLYSIPYYIQLHEDGYVNFILCDSIESARKEDKREEHHWRNGTASQLIIQIYDGIPYLLDPQTNVLKLLKELK
jgi:hypothetical protein